jgi:hypothetical protein
MLKYEKILHLNASANYFFFLLRTTAGEGPPVPLDEAEVVVWKNRDFDEIRIEWADRCSVDGYRLEMCRQPDTVECRNFDVKSPTDGYPMQVVTDLQSCTAYSFKIWSKMEVDQILFEGFYRTQVDTSKNFEFVPSNFDVSQNSTSIVVKWRHNSDCIVRYQTSVTLATVDSIGNIGNIDIAAPDLSVPDTDSLTVLEFSGENLFKQCRTYSLSILPILNTTELDDEVKTIPFTKNVLFFNEPSSPDDVIVVKKTTNDLELVWTNFPLCYDEYHVTVTRVNDDRGIFAGEIK